MLFPRKDTYRTIFCICSTHNLVSAKRDGYAMAHRFLQLGFTPIIIIDSKSEGQWIDDKFEGRVQIVYTLDIISKFTSLLKDEPIPNDVIINISGHGYNSNEHNFFLFNGIRIDRKIMREWYRGLEESNHQIVTFIDTCHSQNMVGFQKKEGIQESQLIAIAGCSKSESLMENISDEYGYGGGLTCSILDAIKGKKFFDLRKLTNKCKGDLSKLGATIVITSASS